MKKILCLAVAATAITWAQAPDFSKVEIKANKISSNFYMLEGQGGQIGVLTGPDGVFMVDGQFAPLSDKIAAAIKGVGGGQIRLLVNTHVHGDHTGGNENFGKMGATIIARPELRYRLAHPNPLANGQPAPATPEIGLPKLLYVDTLTVPMNGEEIHIIAIPHAHTDGDSIVHFVNNDVIMTGDFYRSVQFPNVDRGNGGSLNGLIDGLSRVIALAGPNTKIIPGHGPIVDRNAVMANRDMTIAIRAKISGMVKQGMTLEQVIAAKPLAEFDGKVQQAGTTGDRFIGQAYADIKAN